MFCIKCGAENKDNSKFCVKCGYNLSNASVKTVDQEKQIKEKQNGNLFFTNGEQTENSFLADEEKTVIFTNSNIEANQKQVEDMVIDGTKKKKRGFGKFIKIILPIVLVLGIAVVLLYNFLGYKYVVYKYMKSNEKADVAAMIEIEVPSEIWEEACKDWHNMTPSQFAALRSKPEHAFWKALKKEGKVDFSFKTKETEKLSKLDALGDEVEEAFDISDLETFKDMLKNAYGEYGFEGSKVKNPYAMEVEYCIEIDGEEVLCDTVIFIAYQYGWKWQIYGGLTGSSLVNQLGDEYEEVKEQVQEAWDEYYEEYESYQE